MKKFLLPVIIVLTLLLAHGLYSNFYKVIGPNYLIRTAAYERNQDKFFPRICQTNPSEGSCLVNCPAFGFDNPNQSSPRIKGFPFQSNNYDNTCLIYTPYNASDFNLARALDYAYLALICICLIAAVKKSRR